MSEVLSRHIPERIVTDEIAGRADHLVTARQMFEHLGKMAIGLAIDRYAQASLFGDTAATCFWGRVCEELADTAISVASARIER